MRYGTATPIGSSIPTATSYTRSTNSNQDWGPSGDYGVITKAKIVVTKEYGSGVVIGVRVNDNPKTLFLWVEKKTKTIGYSRG